MRRWGSTTCGRDFTIRGAGGSRGQMHRRKLQRPFAGDARYGYAGMNPVGNIDPSGLFFGGFVSFSLGNTLRGLAISTVTTGITYVLSDVIAKLALNFVPLEIQSRLNTLDSAVPDAILGGITGSLTIGTGGISGGFVGGMELLVSPNTGRAAAYWYGGATITLGSTGGYNIGGWASLSGSVYLGTTYNTPTSLDYQGPFDSVTLPTGFLLPRFARMFGVITGYAAIGVNKLIGRGSLGGGPPTGIGSHTEQWSKLAQGITQFAGSSLASQLDKTSTTLFWNPNNVTAFGWDVGFALGSVKKTTNKGVQFSAVSYKQFSPLGPDKKPQSEAFR